VSLAKLYDRGKGVETDKAAAYRWYRLAATQSGVFRETAAREAKRLGKILADEEKERARRWVRAWQARGIWTRQFER
jgi:TPR repeat protein